MPVIGVRALKNDATRIVRAVREEAAEYTVTVNGVPVAVLRPYTSADDEAGRARELQAVLDDILEASHAVAAAWKSPLSSVQTVADQRR